MKTTKILLIVTLLISAQAFATAVPAFVKTTYSAIRAAGAKAISASAQGARYIWNQCPKTSADAKALFSAGLTQLKQAGSSACNLVKTHPKMAIATAAVLTVITGLTLVHQNQTRAKATQEL